MQLRIGLAFWAASSYCWLMSNLLISQYPQVFLYRAALTQFITQSAVKQDCPDPGAGPCTCLVELHKICLDPLLKLVKVFLDGMPSLQHVNSTTQLDVICKLVEDALSPIIYIINKDLSFINSILESLRECNSEDIICVKFPVENYVSFNIVNRHSLMIPITCELILGTENLRSWLGQQTAIDTAHSLSYS